MTSGFDTRYAAARRSGYGCRYRWVTIAVFEMDGAEGHPIVFRSDTQRMKAGHYRADFSEGESGRKGDLIFRTPENKNFRAM